MTNQEKAREALNNLKAQPSGYSFVYIHRCRKCGSDKHKAVRTEWVDGVKTQRRQCEVCGFRFRHVFVDDPAFAPDPGHHSKGVW